jgi:hypothetical protein
MKRYGLLVLIGGIMAVMVGIFILGNKAEAPQETARVGQKMEDQGQRHLKEGETFAEYNSNPATSGPHNSTPAPWGIKDQEIPDQTLVHNLEHGGIVISYKPDLPADQIEQLKQIFNTLPESSNFNKIKAILVPRAANDRPISLTAWTYIDHLDSPDGAKIKEFYLSHIDKAPELVP